VVMGGIEIARTAQKKTLKRLEPAISGLNADSPGGCLAGAEVVETRNRPSIDGGGGQRRGQGPEVAVAAAQEAHHRRHGGGGSALGEGLLQHPQLPRVEVCQRAGKAVLRVNRK